MSSLPSVEVIVSMPFEENTYVIWQDGRNDAVVVDPGLEPELILDFLKNRKRTVAAILNTHGHADHIGGNGVLKQAFPHAPLIIGRNEAHLLTNSKANLSGPFGFPITSPPADRLVDEGEIVEAAGLAFEVREIPGHSPGHVVFILHGQPTLVFGGDVLFQGGIGRFDFPGGSAKLLLSGIRSKLFNLPDDAEVFPGHGPATTIGHERRTNPYLTGEGL